MTELETEALADIRLRDELAIAAMRSLLLIGAKTESMSEIASMAYRVADEMMDARGEGVTKIWDTYANLAKARKPKEKQ